MRRDAREDGARAGVEEETGEDDAAQYGPPAREDEETRAVANRDVVEVAAWAIRVVFDSQPCRERALYPV